MSNAYREIIDLLSGGLLDLQKVSLYFAKEHPEMFVVAVKEIGALTTAWQAKADALLKKSNKVSAIKEVRAATGWDLKTSKDWCDKREDELGLVRF